MSTTKKTTPAAENESAAKKPKRTRAAAKKTGESKSAKTSTTPRKPRKKKTEPADETAVAEMTPVETETSKEGETEERASKHERVEIAEPPIAERAPVKMDEIAQAPTLGETALGTLSAEADTEPEMETRATGLPIEPAPKHEPLHLARGAFIALRKSGGLNFSTREVVVYPDGRVAYDARGVSQKDYNRLPRVLNDGQVHSLRKLFDHVNFWHAESAGEQNPDAFAYEITARLGQRANYVQVFDGSIPENLKPLLDRLTPLLPREEEP